MQKSLFLLLTIFCLHSVSALYEEKDFIHYTVKEGLSENYITCINQDEWGYIWIGTDIGLNRFDGHTFIKFFQGSKTLPLLSSTIRNIKSFSPNHFGITHRGGFQLLDTKDLSVKNYTIPDSTAFSVYRNAAWDVCQLPDKSFAVTTASGFYVFNEAGKLSFRYDAYHLKDVGQKRILFGRDIFPVGKNEFLVFINGYGLALYNAEKKLFTEKVSSPVLQNPEKWKALSPLVPDTAIGFVSRYQLSRDEFILLQISNNNVVYYNKALNRTVASSFQFSSNEFSWESKITLLNDSSFLVNGGHSGFYQFHINRMSGKITADPKKRLASHKIQCLYLDKHKRLWAGTSKGLLQQKLVAPVIKTYSYQPSSADTITGGLSCAYRYENKLYIGRLSLNKGLVVADAVTGKAEKQVEFYGKNNPWNVIRSIQMYHADTLWLGTDASLLWFHTKTFNYGKLWNEKKHAATLSGINILAPAGKDGYAWMLGHLDGVAARYHIATRAFTFFTSKTNPALPFDKIKSIAYDAYGDVWIGGHSLTRWNSQKQIFDTLISVYSGPNKYQEDILTLVADNKGSLWLHNAFNGLLEYRIREKKFVSYTMKDGLPSDVFYGFSSVVNNQLWMAGNNNLTGLNILTKKISVYDYQDGLPANKPSGRYLYYDSLKRMLYLFNQHQLSTMNLPQQEALDYSNELMIEQLTVNNKDHFFYPVAGLQLKPNQRNISLHFGIINFESGNSYQFAYKLNKTENWTEIGEVRDINLTGLSPGRYSIQLKATGKSGEQKLKEFTFSIKPPFWRTAWFMVGCMLLLFGTLYYFYRSRIKQIRQKANIDKLLAQTEMKALHAQMNPHFIFNSLNSIREMVLNNENKEASHFLSKFAQLIRMTLNQSRQSFISLGHTIDYLQRYAEMEQVRNGLFTFRILTDEGLDAGEIFLPPMLIQPFIENAIWHGTTSTKKNIKINIDFKKQNNQLVCIINDNGIGIEQSLQQKTNEDSRHKSVGISNIRDRISLLNEKYKLQCSVTIEDKSGLAGYNETGTLVTLKLPLEITDHD